jgi:hypothetical protein
MTRLHLQSKQGEVLSISHQCGWFIGGSRSLDINLGNPPAENNHSDTDMYLSHDNLDFIIAFLESKGYKVVSSSTSTYDTQNFVNVVNLTHHQDGQKIQLLVLQHHDNSPDFINSYDMTLVQTAVSAAYRSKLPLFNAEGVEDIVVSPPTLQWTATFKHPADTLRRTGTMLPFKKAELCHSRSAYMSFRVNKAMQIYPNQCAGHSCRQLALVKKISDRIEKYKNKGYCITNLPAVELWHYPSFVHHVNTVTDTLKDHRAVPCYTVYTITYYKSNLIIHIGQVPATMM